MPTARKPLLLLALAVVLPGMLRAQDDLITLEEQAVVAATEKAAASVVKIETFGGLESVGNRLVGTGPTTGLIISSDGYIISSSFNFVQIPTTILVTLPDGKRQPAEVLGRDESRMLVLLKVKAEQPLPVPEFAQRDQLQVGQWTIALGRTYGGEQPNISTGILSATNRIWGKAVQTDAKISPANYGGPLIDLQGRVIGILVPLSPQQQTELAGSEWYDSGIGFAIPLGDVLPHLDTLKSKLDLKAGQLGVRLKGSDIYALPAELAAVVPNSPAYDAGMKAGDVIVELDGQPITRQAQLKHALGPKYAGDKIQIVVTRGEDQQRKTFEVELTDEIPPYEHPFLGILPARQPVAEGIGVRFVYPDSAAARAGIQPGDVLKQLDHEPVEDLPSLLDRVARYQPGESVPATIRAKGSDTDTQVSLAKLGTLPVAVPVDVPPAEVPAPEGDPNQAERGLVEVNIPEEENKCFAYVPDSYAANIPHGLLVWIRAPGEFNKDDLEKDWKEICNTFHLILLAPQPADSSRWLPTETAFIRKTIDDVLNRYTIDRTRVVVHGYQAGGAIGYLVAFSNRDVVRGMAAVDAPVPGRFQVPPNEPTERLAIYSVHSAESKLAKNIEAGQQRLAENKFPVTEIQLSGAARYLNEAERQELARWIDTLDRF